MSAESFHPRASQSDDEAAVRALYTQAMEGWNTGSAEAFAAPFATDGHLVAFDGTHFKGRDEIVAFHQPLFDTWLKGTRLVASRRERAFPEPRRGADARTRRDGDAGENTPCAGAGLDADARGAASATAHGASRHCRTPGSDP